MTIFILFHLAGLMFRQGLAELFFGSLWHGLRSLSASEVVDCYSGKFKTEYTSDILVG